MKRNIWLLSLLVAGITLLVGCGQSSGRAIQYHCPMHPTVVADRPGDCPICGMKLVKMDTAPAPSASVPVAAGPYECPMNAEFVSDKPGKCPKCGMNLVPRKEANAAPGLAAVDIAPAARERMGLVLAPVQKREMSREVRAPARVAVDETQLYHVTLKVDGYVEELFAATKGEFVRMGDPLLTIYSPMLVTAQQEYLNVVRDNPGLAAAARRRLQLLDITDEQIVRLDQEGKPDRTITLRAPASGWILEQNIARGHRVMAGEQLMVLGNLSNVWADAEIFQSDLPYVKTGMPVLVSFSAAPNRLFSGAVGFIAPVLDAETRTIKVRLNIPNPDLALRPEMYGVAEFSQDLGEKLAVPDSAVLRTGEHNYVFREAADGRLAPMDVRLGAHSDGWFEVLSGLNPGDRVVTSANFLIDSESSMKAAIEALTGK